MVQILVADDNESIRMLMDDFLTQKGFEVLLAENGNEALDIFNANFPPVIILDLRMPDLDGIGFLKSMDPQKMTTHGVIVMTGHGDDDAIKTCFELGVQSFLRKPVNLFELQGSISRCLHLHNSISETQQLNRRLLLRQQDIPNFMWECDQELCFTYVDENMTPILGYEPENLIAKPISDFLTNADILPFFYKFRENVRQLNPHIRGAFLEFKTRERDPVQLQFFADGIEDRDGHVTGLVGVCRDMSAFTQFTHEADEELEEMLIQVDSQLRLVSAGEGVQNLLAAGTDLSVAPIEFLPFLADPSLKPMFEFSLDQKEDIPFPMEINLTDEPGKQHNFTIQFKYNPEACCAEGGPCMEGLLVPSGAGDQLELISRQMDSQKKKLEDQSDVLKEAIVLDDDMKQSILKDAQNLSAETLTLVKSLEGFAFPAESAFSLEEYNEFLFNRNLQVVYDDLRLLGNKIHGLKGSCGFLMLGAKQLCHKMEEITRPLAEQKLVLTKEITFLLKQFVFKVQDMLEIFQANSDPNMGIDDWEDRIDRALEQAQSYVRDQLSAFREYIVERCKDNGEIRKRRVEEYLSVSLNGYEQLAEQVKDLFYSLSEALSDDESIQAGNLYNQFLKTHQEIKKVPLDLSRYERMIPSLAKEYDKEADFIFQDHQVKADREFWAVIHEILNHMLKNAVIHGLELPKERQQQSKESTGQVTVKLREDALFIHLTVADDGRGIDVDRVTEKALENNVLTKNQLDGMGEQEVLELLFIQGVSTIDSVDDNAGRGVGMNAVQEAMNQLQGTCRIQTEPGKGTSWHFTFAKANVSLPCVLVTIGDICFAIPEDYVETFLDYRENRSFTIKQNAAYQYNGHPVPMIEAEKTFEIEPNPNALNGKHKNMMILKASQGKRALVINEILHHAVMPILPLPRIYRNVPIYLGITIFKNDPIQVVNVESLF